MNVISLEDKEYPELLREIGKQAPKQLYYKGNWDKEIFENCLAVVGSRQMTTYGQRVEEQIVAEVAAAGVTIVSGFMYGIDAESHKAALRVGGRTIAVMPCGIDLIHPEYQQDLYNEILDNKGLIISEYDGDIFPTLWMYPKRNRIVAGLSKAVLVIEAGEKSGSLITANLAKKFKRKIFAVPGQITSTVSKGTLELIRNGAEAVSSSKDVLREYGFSSRFTPEGSYASQKTHTSLEHKIINHLQKEPMEADELARSLSVSAASLGTTLSLMQLKGFIQQDGNKYYVS